MKLLCHVVVMILYFVAHFSRESVFYAKKYIWGHEKFGADLGLLVNNCGFSVLLMLCSCVKPNYRIALCVCFRELSKVLTFSWTFSYHCKTWNISVEYERSLKLPKALQSTHTMRFGVLG